MSGNGDGGRTQGGGQRAQGGGTPMAVDVAGDRDARLNIALFVAGPAIWSVHFMVVYLVTEAGCRRNDPGLRLFDPPVPTIVTLVATAVAAVACAGVAWWCYRRWQAVRGQAAEQDADGTHDGGGVLPFGGFLLALLGIVTVLFVGLPALALPTC